MNGISENYLRTMSWSVFWKSKCGWIFWIMWFSPVEIQLSKPIDVPYMFMFDLRMINMSSECKYDWYWEISACSTEYEACDSFFISPRSWYQPESRFTYNHSVMTEIYTNTYKKTVVQSQSYTVVNKIFLNKTYNKCMVNSWSYIWLFFHRAFSSYRSFVKHISVRFSDTETELNSN
jgi:hypothetical protein